MSGIHLIHWNDAEAKERLARLRAAGFRAVREPLEPGLLLRWREDPPAAVVIDLDRLPSLGRDVALAIRERKGTRRVPIVFVEGDRAKVARIRKLLPDATFATWSGIRGALKRAIARPPADPVVPRSRLDGYSGTPLPKKLGIKPGAFVALVGAPSGFEKTLGEIPEGAVFTRKPGARTDLILWFVRGRAELARGVRTMARHLPDGAGLWIAWPKKGSTLESDVGERDVRALGLAAGLVDYKVCAIDATWSGLKFARRRKASR